jgi:hypothetical protein
MLQDEKVAGSIPDEVIRVLNWLSPSSRTRPLGSTQPLTEMSIRNLPGSKVRPTRKADNLIVISKPIDWKMWEPRRLNLIGLHGLLTFIIYAIFHLLFSPSVYLTHPNILPLVCSHSPAVDFRSSPESSLLLRSPPPPGPWGWKRSNRIHFISSINFVVKFFYSGYFLRMMAHRSRNMLWK